MIVGITQGIFGGAMNIIVEPHALKHGLSVSEIRYAWATIMASRLRGDDSEPPRWIAIGWLPDGRLAQMVAIEDNKGDWRIFHAMTPPTKSFCKELGL